VAFGNNPYPLTFHPDVTDEAKSPIIEVTPGIEATGIDVTVGRIVKTYAASGRIIDAETRAPGANLQLGIGSLSDQNGITDLGWTNSKSNLNGEFRIEGLTSGRFAAFVVKREESDFYSEPSVFEVATAMSAIEVASPRIKHQRHVASKGMRRCRPPAKVSKVAIKAYANTQPPASAPGRDRAAVSGSGPPAERSGWYWTAIL
jgi:hypothetical protein